MEMTTVKAEPITTASIIHPLSLEAGGDFPARSLLVIVSEAYWPPPKLHT